MKSTPKSPAFQFYPDKWLVDTRRLSYEAKGVFIDFMSQVWIQNQEVCSVPNDDDFIAGEIGCPIDVWQRAKAELLNPNRPILVVTETNRLFVRGLFKEREKQRVRREKLRENGKKGGRPKTKRKPGRDNLNESLPSPPPIPSPPLSLEREGEAPPTHFPEIEIPPWEDVRFHADKIGLPEWRAKDWFNEMEAVGWKDKSGREIISWRAMLARVKSWWERDGRPVEPPVRVNGSRPNSPMDIKTVIQAKETLAAQIRQKFCSDTAIDSVWSDDSKKREFFALKREVKRLNVQLSSMA